MTKISNLKLYPNPVKTGSIFEVDFSNLDGAIDYSIYSLGGKILLSGKTSGGKVERIKLPNSIPSGYYFLRILGKEKIGSAVLIVVD